MPIKSPCLTNECFPHPSLLQPPLPTTPIPVPREPSRKPLPVSPSTEGLRSPSPPPRSRVPAPRPSAPALSPTLVSPSLLHLLSGCGEAELSLGSEAKAWSDPSPCWGFPAPRPLLTLPSQHPHLHHPMLRPAPSAKSTHGMLPLPNCQ